MQALIRFTERFGNMISRTFLIILYFLVLGPFAIVYQLVADPLRIRKQRGGNWRSWDARNENLAAARRQD